MEITNCNFEDAGKLYLVHKHAGIDLQLEYAQKTVKHIRELWGREVILECIINKKPTLIKCCPNGKIEITEIVDDLVAVDDSAKVPAPMP